VPVVLLATDADQLRDEVDAALGDDETTVHRVRAGRDVAEAVRQLRPDLVLLDLQIGNMGGMATGLSLRSEEGAGRLDHRHPVLMLLDRTADVFLARRSDADGWLIKPLDAFRLRRAATALLEGGEYHEGIGVVPTHDAEPMNVVVPDQATPENPAEPESGMASALTESSPEAEDTAMDTADNAETDEDDPEAKADAAQADTAEAAEG
jgi:DNA-binding response OmpR family regulator